MQFVVIAWLCSVILVVRLVFNSYFLGGSCRSFRLHKPFLVGTCQNDSTSVAWHSRTQNMPRPPDKDPNQVGAEIHTEIRHNFPGYCKRGFVCMSDWRNIQSFCSRHPSHKQACLQGACRDNPIWSTCCLTNNRLWMGLLSPGTPQLSSRRYQDRWTNNLQI